MTQVAQQAPPGSEGAPLLPIQQPRPYARRFMRGLFRLLFPFYGGLVVKGLDNIPKTGPVLFCPNHISDLDPVALYASVTRTDLYFMGKQELFEMRAGNFFRYHGGFPVKRYTADRAALRTGEHILKKGHCLVLYPEGALSETGKLMPLHPGASMIAVGARPQIVPVGMAGTNGMLPYAKLIPQRGPGPAVIEYGVPIRMEEFDGMSHKAKLQAISARIESELRRLTGQPAPDDAVDVADAPSQS